MRKLLLVVLILPIFFSCAKKVEEKKQSLTKYITNKKIQEILNFYNLDGVILIYNSKNKKYYSNNFTKAKKAFLPASTFKIPNTIIGLETNFLKNEESVFKWNGEKRYLSSWEKDLSLQEAFQFSCVPCYQELAKKIGVTAMNNFLNKINFGKMDVNLKTISNFWLTGNSKISPLEQIKFLIRFYNEALPIKKTTTQIVKNIMKTNVTKSYILSGKTGLATSNSIKTGWFVGFVEVDKNVIFFATKVTPKVKISTKKFIPLRKKVTMLALKKLQLINE